MLNYYHRFISDLAADLQPLIELLNKEKKWQWTTACKSASQKAKTLLVSEDLLIHYDPKLPLSLA